MFFGMVCWNRYQLKPTDEEVKILNQFYGNIKINSSRDIFRIQNLTIDSIKHDDTGSQELSIQKTLKLGKGLCFDRSLVLQKILIINNIKICPVYFFFNPLNPINTSIFDFFKLNTNSHNLFIFKFNDKWYLMKTIFKMKKFETIEEYLNSKSLPYGTKYFKHLNNRNGRFIFPSWLPDIY